MKKHNHTMQCIFGAVLIAIGLIVVAGVLLIRSQAQNVTTTVSNSAPTVSNEKLCVGSTASTNAGISACSDLAASINLTAGTTTDFSYVIQVTDLNGTGDLDTTATAVLYHTGDSDTGDDTCTSDNNNCYRNDATCSQITPVIDATNAWYRCDVSMEYYSLYTIGSGGNWFGSFLIEDAADAQGTDDSYLGLVQRLTAATFPTVSFGAVNLGFVSVAGDNIEVAHQNNGNYPFDMRVLLDDDDADDAIDCATGIIPVGNVKFDHDDLSGDVGYASASRTLIAQGSGVGDVDIEVANRTNDSSAQGPNNPDVAGDDIRYTYWNISVPTSGIQGACTEELNVSVFEYQAN